MNDEILTIDELAEYLKVSRVTINRLRDRGLPWFKVGKNVRFKKNEVLKWLDEQQEN